MADLAQTTESLKSHNGVEIVRTNDRLQGVSVKRKNEDSAQDESFKDSIESKIEYIGKLSSSSIGAQRVGLKDIKSIVGEIERNNDLTKEEKESLLAKLDENKKILKEQTSVTRNLGDKITGGVEKIGGAVSFALGGSPLAMFVTSFISRQTKEFLERRKRRKEEKAARKEVMKTNTLLSKIKSVLSMKSSPQKKDVKAKRLTGSAVSPVNKKGGKFGNLGKIALLGLMALFSFMMIPLKMFAKGIGATWKIAKGAIMGIVGVLSFFGKKMQWLWTTIKSGFVKLMKSLGLGKLVTKVKPEVKAPTKGREQLKKETLTRSERAKLQPRDEKGRFIKQEKLVEKAGKKGIASKITKTAAVKAAARVGLRFIPILGWAYTAADLAALAFTGGEKDLFDLAKSLESNNGNSSEAVKDAKDIRERQIRDFRGRQATEMKLSNRELARTKLERETKASGGVQPVSPNMNMAAQQNITNILQTRLNPRNEESSLLQANLAGAL